MLSLTPSARSGAGSGRSEPIFWRDESGRDNLDGVELGHEFPVRGAGRCQLVGTFLELMAQFDDLLVCVGERLLQGADIIWCAEPTGTAPSLSHTPKSCSPHNPARTAGAAGNRQPLHGREDLHRRRSSTGRRTADE
jgi:hypothetical protein